MVKQVGGMDNIMVVSALSIADVTFTKHLFDNYPGRFCISVMSTYRVLLATFTRFCVSSRVGCGSLIVGDDEWLGFVVDMGIWVVCYAAQSG
jgi:hypothetical protein